MHHRTDRIGHTTAFVTQSCRTGSTMKDRPDNPRSSVCLYSLCCFSFSESTTHVYTMYKPTDDINTWILCANHGMLKALFTSDSYLPSR